MFLAIRSLVDRFVDGQRRGVGVHLDILIVVLDANKVRTLLGDDHTNAARRVLIDTRTAENLRKPDHAFASQSVADNV